MIAASGLTTWRIFTARIRAWRRPSPGLPRDNYTLISKIWWGDGGIPEAERPDADVVVARFLKELKTDHIDLLLLHCVTAPDWPEQLRKQMDILSKLKSQGKIRALGVSCHSHRRARSGGGGAVGGIRPHAHQSLRHEHGWQAGTSRAGVEKTRRRRQRRRGHEN